jgi:tetratricopeptide (TPR) repeat protein
VRALSNVKEASDLLAELPRTPKTRALGARVHLESARAKWAGAGTHPGITLSNALASIELAARTLPADAPVALVADLASVLAAIAYDIGEAPLVGHAIDALHRASGVMVTTGDAVRAARLSNDEAALHMRFGATARAGVLLARSCELLRATRAQDPAALRELAVTEHLRARLPLHDEDTVASREVLSEALEHASAAEQLYAELGQRRGAARVLETVGRLELLAGLPAQAERHVLEALRIEETFGDATGLARATAALAELLAHNGKMDEAIQLIETSATLNLRRGAASALAYNRRAVARLRATTARNAPTDEKLRALENTLSRSPRAVAEEDDNPRFDGVRLPSAS